jgi:peroxiredoxin
MSPLAIGDPAPAFELPGTDGARHALFEDGTAATVVVFTCNHCPYALAWEERLIEAAKDYGPRGVRFLAICSNDAERYPADSFERMVEHAEQGGWPFAYLHDESQAVAGAWGARVTPDVFLLDGGGRVRYRGAPDADHGDPAQGAAWLRAALDAVLAGEEPETAETEPVGCSIKWRR